MKYEPTRQPNFIAIKGTGQRVDIGLMGDGEFLEFSREQSIALWNHYKERRAKLEESAATVA